MGLLDRALRLKSGAGSRQRPGLRARAALLRTNTVSSGDSGRGLLYRASLFRDEKKKDIPTIEAAPVAGEDIKAIRDALERKVLDLTNLFEISKEIHGTLNQETLLSTLLFSAMGQMGVQKIAVCVRQAGDGFSLAAQKGLDTVAAEEISFPLPGTLAGCFADSDQPVETEALAGRLDQNELEALRKAAAVLVTPLINKENLVAVLLLGERYDGTPFGGDDKEFLATLASMAAISMENVRLYSRLDEKLHQLAALYEISKAVNSSKVRDQVLHLVGETLWTGFGLRLGALYLLEEHGFRLSRTYGFATASASQKLLPADHTEFSAVLTMGEAADFPDFGTRASLNSLFQENVSRDFQSMLLVPLLAAGRQVGILAVFALEGRGRRAFRKEEKELFSIIASQIAPPVLIAGFSERK